jgi:hypothetical protein
LYGAPKPDSEVCVLVRNTPDGVLQPPLHGASGSVDGGLGSARLGAPSGRARELARDGLHLVPSALGFLDVATSLGILDRFAQGFEARPVGAEGIRIEELARVPAVGVIARAGELENVDGDVRLRNETRQVLHAARGLEAKDASRGRNREVLALRDHFEGARH